MNEKLIPAKMICTEFKKAVADAAENYLKNKDNSYLSIIYKHKREKLENTLLQLEKGPSAERLLKDLRLEIVKLTRLIEEEEFHPTFDWSGEHYWETVYTGEKDGCKEAVSILEAFIPQ